MSEYRLARHGNVSPIGSVSASSRAVTIAGQVWDLYIGMNGDMKVFSFLPSSKGKALNTFAGDIKGFFDHIKERHAFPAEEQYLLSRYFLSLFLPTLFWLYLFRML